MEGFIDRKVGHKVMNKGKDWALFQVRSASPRRSRASHAEDLTGGPEIPD